MKELVKRKHYGTDKGFQRAACYGCVPNPKTGAGHA
jgi:hypothetical protein